MFGYIRVLVTVGAVLAGLTACSEDAEVSGEVDLSADVDVPGDVEVSGDEVCQGAADSMVDAASGVADSFRESDVDDFGDVVASFGGFVDAAPEEIRADVRVLFDGYAAYLEVWLENGIDTLVGDEPDEAAQQAMAAAEAELSSSEFEAARDRVGDWLEDHCTDTSTTVDAD